MKLAESAKGSVEAVREKYQGQERDFEAALHKLQLSWWNWGWARGIAFLLGLAPLLAAVTNYQNRHVTWWWLFGLAIVVFLGIAGWHETLVQRIRIVRLQLRLARHSLARLDRRLKEVNDPVMSAPPNEIAVGRDLDLYGEHSLYKLVGTARTPIGSDLIREWIARGARRPEILDRQQAIAALKNEMAWRDRFELLCAQLAASQQGPSDFVNWCQSPDWLKHRPYLLWLSWGGIGLTCLGLAGILLGLLGLAVGIPMMLIGIVVNFFLSVFFAGPVHDVFNQISSRHEETRCYQVLFDWVAACPAKSPRIDTLRQQVFEDGDILQGMRQLGLLVWFANLRRNGIMFLFYLFLQLGCFWDLHVLHRLEGWKRRYRQRAQHWFRDLGEWEALTALAKFAADHPHWVFPEIVDGSKRNDAGSNPSTVVRRTQMPKGPDPISNRHLIRARKLGHPLLPQAARVDNDVNVGPNGTFLLVTGSNMSGKSTLLRSIGLNVALAQMGSVVCAEEMSLPCLVMDTSMRISDSLSEGVSFFMAELKRLKQIVDRSHTIAHDPECGHLFLLDEILQGTNSRERQIAVAQVIEQLVDQGSIGAISTHDLELAGVDSLRSKCEVVHFSESFVEKDGQEIMTFDYVMRPGIAPTTNALKLLELVGLHRPTES